MRRRSILNALLLAAFLAAPALPAAWAEPASPSPVSERERFEAEQRYRDRQLSQAAEELRLKAAEQSQSRWTSPLVLAIVAAAIAALGNSFVAFFNGRQQRILEKTRADENRKLERQKAKDQVELEKSKAEAQRALDEQQAESARILEATKTAGSREAAAVNLEFLLQAGLVTGALAERLGKYLATRRPGEGPSLPSADGRFAFEADSGADLPPDTQTAIAATLDRFCAWLDQVGFVRPEDAVTIGAADMDTAYYDGSVRRVMLGPSFRDPLIACREYMHHVLLETSPSGFSGEHPYRAIECGVADYFPASFVGRPYVGEGLGRKFGEAQDWLRALTSDKGHADLSAAGGPNEIYTDGEIWGSLFWDIRETLGAGAADRLLRDTWTGTTWPKAKARMEGEFLKTLVGAAAALGAAELAAVRSVLEKRGFPVPGDAVGGRAAKAGNGRRVRRK
jgi:hypothetical protein